MAQDVTKPRVGTRPARYLIAARRPLPILLFLLPLIALYAVGSIVFASGLAVGTEQTLDAIFGVFGVFGRHLPSIALITTYLILHLIRKDPWNVRPRTLALMSLESIVLALPLLVLSRALAMATLADTPVDPHDLELGARLTLAVGAGLFEETLYRLVLISVIHALAVDALGLKNSTGWAIAILVSAGIFAAVHHLPPNAGTDATMIRAFYFIAAAYFGGVFASRGLGIAVGAHIVYDIAALL